MKTISDNRSLNLIVFLCATLSFLGCTKKEAASVNDVTDPSALLPSASQGPKVLNFTIGDDVKSGDPANFNDVISAEVMGHIFEGLYSFQYLGRLGEIEAALADGMPAYTDKNKTVTIKIKKGVLFQDDAAFENGKGREVNAEDFIFSLKRIGDPIGTGTNWWMFDGMIEGFNEWRKAIETATPDARPALFDKAVSGLQAPDSHTLVIKLIKPYPQLLPILAMNPTAVVAKEVAAKYGPEIMNHPVGTGPYKLKEWVRGSKVIVHKNPNFREEFYPSIGSDEDKSAGLLEAAGKKLPFVDEIVWEVVKEEQPRWLLMRSGKIAEAGIPKDNFKEAIGANGMLSPELTAEGLVLHKAQSLTSWWLEFNLKDPLLGKNKNLRKAIAYAFDRAQALTLLYNNRGTLSDNPVPPALEGGSPNPPYELSYNLEKAKKALADAGYPNGKGLAPLSLDLRGTGETPRQFGELLQNQLAAVGIKLNILANSFPEALEKAKTSKFQMMLAGWAADYPDPENFLALWYGPNAAPGTNSSNFNNKEYDKLYDQIRFQLPGPDREKAVHKMVQILVEEAPSVFFYHAIDYRLSRNWLKNYHPHLLLYGMGKYLDVDQDLRAQTKK